MNTQWGNLGPRVGMAWDPSGDGKTSVRASYGRSFEFVNAQFHLNTSVAPPWGSEVRINQPPGGLDNPFINTQGQTNIFPVTFDQNAPFSLNGPFLSLSNDMAATHVDQWNITRRAADCRERGSRRPATWAAGPATSGNRRRSTTPCSRTSAPPPPSAANINARRPFTLAGSGRTAVLRSGGPVRHRRQAAIQRHAAVGPRSAAPGTTLSANYTLVALLRIAGRLRRRARPTCRSGYNKPERSRLRRRQLHGRPAAELHDDRQRRCRGSSTSGCEVDRVRLAARRQLPGADRALADHHDRRGRAR